MLCIEEEPLFNESSKIEITYEEAIEKAGEDSDEEQLIKENKINLLNIENDDVSADNVTDSNLKHKSGFAPQSDLQAEDTYFFGLSPVRNNRLSIEPSSD